MEKNKIRILVRADEGELDQEEAEEIILMREGSIKMYGFDNGSDVIVIKRNNSDDIQVLLEGAKDIKDEDLDDYAIALLQKTIAVMKGKERDD